MGRVNGEMRTVRAATGQKAWPTHQGVQSPLEEYTPFKTQMGMRAEWLEATHKSERVAALWAVEC